MLISNLNCYAAALNGMRRLLQTVGICALLLAALYALMRPYHGKAFDSYETSSKAFRVRIVAYHEAALIPVTAGAYYVFQTGASEGWREIMTFRHDDPVEIPRGQIRFVGDRIGYAFMGWMYAVTTDGG